MGKQAMRLTGLALAMVLSGCQNTVPVKLELPVNRLESPEPAARRVSLGLTAGETTYAVFTPDQITTAPDAQNPAIGRCPPKQREGDAFLLDADDCGGMLLKADLRAAPWLQLGLRRSADQLLIGQGKVFLHGRRAGEPAPGDTSAALTLAYGRDRYRETDQNANGPVETDLQRSLVDLGLIGGYRVHRRVLVFGGPFLQRSDYEGEHRRNERRQTDGGGGGNGGGPGGLLPGGGGSGGGTGTQIETVTTVLDDRAELRGLNLGLRWETRSGRFGLMGECARAQASVAESRAYVNRCATAMELAFGGGREP